MIILRLVLLVLCLGVSASATPADTARHSLLSLSVGQSKAQLDS